MRYLKSIFENFQEGNEFVDTVEDFFVELIDDGQCTSSKGDVFAEFKIDLKARLNFYETTDFNTFLRMTEDIKKSNADNRMESYELALRVGNILRRLTLHGYKWRATLRWGSLTVLVFAKNLILSENFFTKQGTDVIIQPEKLEFFFEDFGEIKDHSIYNNTNRSEIHLRLEVFDEFQCDECGSSHPGRVPCSDCDSDGYVSCYECDGEGHEDCSECDGNGKIDCGLCDGDGEIECGECEGEWEKECDGCDGEKEVECSCEGEDPDCEDCGGSGKVECEDCGGSGKKECHRCSKGKVECPDCDGEGKLECGECSGSGRSYCEYCGGDGTTECGTCDGSTYEECSECEGEPEKFMNWLNAKLAPYQGADMIDYWSTHTEDNYHVLELRFVANNIKLYLE